MIIFPAIDIKDNNCVRLYKGDFSKKEIFNKSPLDQAKIFEKLGFGYIHVVDLDRALNPKNSNIESIKKIATRTNCKIQVGGGLREMENIEEIFSFGVSSIVLGTGAVTNHKLLVDACEKFPNKISVGIDVRKGFLALKGWTDQTNISCVDFVNKIKNLKIKNIIFTDINKDGTKKGINLIDTLKLAELSNIPIIASGGIAKLDDVVQIRKSKKISGVIIGKAIYDGSINLNELSKLQN